MRKRSIIPECEDYRESNEACEEMCFTRVRIIRTRARRIENPCSLVPTAIALPHFERRNEHRFFHGNGSRVSAAHRGYTRMLPKVHTFTRGCSVIRENHLRLITSPHARRNGGCAFGIVSDDHPRKALARPLRTSQRVSHSARTARPSALGSAERGTKGRREKKKEKKRTEFQSIAEYRLLELQSAARISYRIGPRRSDLMHMYIKYTCGTVLSTYRRVVNFHLATRRSGDMPDFAFFRIPNSVLPVSIIPPLPPPSHPSLDGAHNKAEGVALATRLIIANHVRIVASVAGEPRGIGFISRIANEAHGRRVACVNIQTSMQTSRRQITKPCEHRVDPGLAG